MNHDVVADEGRQATEGLLAGAADAHEQRVAALVQHDTCGGTAPSHEARRLSGGRIDGVEAVWFREDAIDQTSSSSSFYALRQRRKSLCRHMPVSGTSL